MTTESDRQSRELTNQVLMQIRDNLDLIRRTQDKLVEDVHAVSERTARLEERNERLSRAETAIERLDGQVEMLVAEKHKREGAVGVWSWLSTHWPTAGLITALGAFVAWLNGKIDL